MFKVLLRKQFMEINKFYFHNAKTGERRSKKSSTGQIVLFAFIMLFVSFSFFGIGTGLIDAFHPMGLDWLYFFIMALISIMFGAFGSVFNTYASLYKSGDNDLLFSLPIKPDIIMASRLVSVYFMGLMYEAVAFVPAVLAYWINAQADIFDCIVQVMMIFVVGLLVLAISVALGYVVAVLSEKIKSKAFISILSSLLILVLYYFIYFKANNLISAVVENSEYYADKIKKSAFLFYHLGNGMTGNVKSILISCSVIFLFCAIVYLVLRKSFFRLSTVSEHKKSKKKKYKYFASTQKNAVVYKELRRFCNSSVYMMNMGLGLVFMIASGIAALVKSDYIIDFFADEELSSLSGIVPFLAAIIVTMLCGMSCVTAPSISLEGRNFWLLKSLPVSPKIIFDGKIKANTLLSTVPSVISIALISVALKYNIIITVLSFGYVFLFIRFIGRFGLIMNLKSNNMEWTSEAVPIKQSMSVFVTMLVSFVMVLLFAGLTFAVTLDPIIYYVIAIVIVAFLDFVCLKWLNTKGVEKFNSLV